MFSPNSHASDASYRVAATEPHLAIIAPDPKTLTWPPSNTIQDLLRLLDENPEWVDALRARLLTQELLELPERFSQFAEGVNTFVLEMTEFKTTVERFIETTNQFIEATNKRFDALEAGSGQARSRYVVLQR